MVSQPYKLQTLPELADHHFRLWKSAFENLTGIQLGVEREGLVKSILQARVVEKGLSCFENYLQQLQASPAFSRLEWEVLFARLLIGETRFFRHLPTFEFIVHCVKRLLRTRSDGRRLRVWSLGCSSGEEAYSLAMALYKLCRGIVGEQVDFSVIGTDINARSLEIARRGIYANILRRGVDEATATNFFDRQKKGLYAVKPFIRERVTFCRHNILEPASAEQLGELDVILCQNVLIYFQDWRRRAVIRQLLPALKKDGVLVVGSGELLGWKPEGLERISAPDVQAYRKTD